MVCMLVMVTLAALLGAEWGVRRARRAGGVGD